MVLKIVYTVFIGILLVLFVGIGVETFYPQPQYPEYPISLERPSPDGTETAKDIKTREEFQKKEKSYQGQIKIYNRNVFIIALVFALLFMAISLFMAEKLLVIADGLLLGGVFTLAYAVGRGFMADDKFRFIAVSVSLVVALITGYLKFIRPLEGKESPDAG